ncbi:MAG: VWA domain-containing protein [Caulobacterales bacterium]|nr:VWA domain-containing protein [Caulobacterales bacterium]
MNKPPADRSTAVRWRLALGRHAETNLGGAGLSAGDQQLDQAMEALYGRAHGERGYRNRGGSLDLSQIVLPRWLDTLKELFPKSVFETIQSHAIDRFDLGEMLSNPGALKKLEPNLNLLKVLLSFRGRADPSVAGPIREVVKQIVEELRRRLESQIIRALSGSRNRFARSQQKRMANFDIRATVRANLKNYQPDRRAIIAEQLRFTARQRRQMPWTVVLCVDQSGSMLSSLIHAVVTASILASLPAVKVKVVVFDTAVVDVSDRIEDPVDLLLSVQLGGGTNIGQAITYCEGLITQPSRTVFALISDFEEGASPAVMIQAVRRLAEARVTLIGLAALGDDGEPVYDRAMAARLAGAGMEIAALTPDRFAEWLGGVIG